MHVKYLVRPSSRRPKATAAGLPLKETSVLMYAYPRIFYILYIRRSVRVEPGLCELRRTSVRSPEIDPHKYAQRQITLSVELEDLPTQRFPASVRVRRSVEACARGARFAKVKGRAVP